MAFKPRRKRETLDIRLKIGQSAIDRVKETVFLGVILDFTWKPHLANLARKGEGKVNSQW